MRIDITPEPTPEERTAIMAVVEAVYGRGELAGERWTKVERSRYVAPHLEERRGWRERAKLEALADGV